MAQGQGTTTISTWVKGFLVDRKAQGLATGTLDFYRKKLGDFVRYTEANGLCEVGAISPNDLRAYLVHLEQEGHNPGGIHGHYRAIRTFLYWYEAEVEPEDWKNPIRKVKAPRVRVAPLEPVDIGTVKGLIDVCPRGTFTGDRDRAMLLALLDTGARASEFVSLNIEDVDIVTGTALIREGKGGKFRSVYLGRTSRRALRKYLRHIDPGLSHALWLGTGGERMTYWGLRSMLCRRAKEAGVPSPYAKSP